MAGLNTLPTEILQKIIANIPTRPFKTELLLISRALCVVLMTEQVKDLTLSRRQINRWITVITNDDMTKPCSITLYSNLLDKIYKLSIHTGRVHSGKAITNFISRCANLRELVLKSTSLQLSPILDGLPSSVIEISFYGLIFSGEDEEFGSLVGCIRRSADLTKLYLDTLISVVKARRF